jgi:spore maturation protein CgeB/SAM-dependent methyltransferase
MIGRVALIFDNESRPETTGTYCLRALQGLVEVEHFRPAEIGRIPRNSFDLYLNIDDGLRYLLPDDLRPAAWWAIDTHLDFDWCLTKAHDFDFVFAAQRDGAIQLRDAGISTTWLPLACDPEIHRKYGVDKTFDVCFVGNVFPGERADLIQLLQSRFPNTFVGQRYFQEMARTYSGARIVFNRSIRNDVNMRVFEALACGSLLLTNDLRDNGQDELFRDGIHLATYGNADELLDKTGFYLDHEAERERIAAAGREEALARHTYRQRMETLLNEVAKGLSARGMQVGDRQRHLPSVPAGELAVGASAGTASANGDGSETAAGDLSYFEFARPEVLALVPESAKRILDIGCGTGRLGEALKARQRAEVVGIELYEPAALAARQRLDQVLVGNVEQMELPFTPGAFDAVVCADVLEHLRQPESLLRQASRWLGPDGRLVASIPNVRHHSVVGSLLDGNWTYEPAGLLDRTHLRFFTRRDIEQLFQDAGFTLRRLDIVPGPGYEEWQRQGSPGQINAGRLVIQGIAPSEAEEFYVYQYLVTAQPSVANTSAAKDVDGSNGELQAKAEAAKGQKKLRIMLLGDFGSSWRHEAYTANAIAELGHAVRRFHEYLMPSASHVVEELNSGHYDCLLFYKGRIGARGHVEVFAPTGEAIAEVIQRAKVPCYTWYVDRAYQFSFDPSREAWMRRVAPLCRVAFVADAALARTDWARWHVLREPIDAGCVQRLYVAEAERKKLAFIGQVYGDRQQELAPVAAEFPFDVISGVYGADLSRVIQSYKIVLGPRYPTVPGYWGNRVYVVLGHGGFFLAPEVDGMRDEGILAGVHYAPLGDDPIHDIRYWLARPEERARIARAGQDLVLGRFTYKHCVQELCRVMEETL